MKSSSAITALAALLPLASAHTRFTTLAINGQSQGDGTCIRMDMNPSTTTAFVSSLDSPDLACGADGNTPVNRTCPLKAGDSISMLHRSWADGAQPGSIDPSHKGSTAVYMKRVSAADAAEPWSQGDAAGDGWFKIAGTGFDNEAGKWGTEVMIANNGLISTTIPGDLSGGYYLVRSEALALQNIVNEHINPQLYVGCAQVYVESGGSAAPSTTVSIPGYVDASTPAFSYNIYHNTPPAVPFEEFGPAVYTSSGSGSSSGSIETTSKVASTDPFAGSCPSNTVLEIANLCLTELESWSNDTPGSLPKCWAASQSCWDKLDTCWNGLSPAVNAADQNVGCNLWNQKCLNVVSWCEAGNTQGPPDDGKVLTAQKGTLGRRGLRSKKRATLAARDLTTRNHNTSA